MPPFEQGAASSETYRFAEDERPPPEFSTEGEASALEVTNELFHSGGAALKWRWDGPGAVLRFDSDEAFRALTGKDLPDTTYQWVTASPLSALSFNLFNPQAVEDVLWVEIGDGERVFSRFYISLNFRGWQMVRAWYGRDMPGFPDPETTTTIRFHAPESLPQGTLYIDNFAPRTEDDIRGGIHVAELQPNAAVPWVNNPELKGDETDLTDGKPPPAPYLPRPHGYHEFREHQGVLAERPRREIAVPEELSEEQRAILDDLTRRFREPPSAEPPPRALSPERLETLLDIREERRIRRHGDVISGHIGGRPSKFWDEMTRVGRAWRRASDQPEARTQLAQLLRDMAGLVITKGHRGRYFLRTAFVEPLWDLKPFWQEEELWEPLVGRMRDILDVDDFHDPTAEANADVFNTELEARMAVVLAADDTPEKWRDLMAVRAWMDRVSQYGGIKSDGSMHHHWTPNPGYTINALSPLVETLHLLHDTPFHSESMHRASRRAAYAFHFNSNHRHLPNAIGGRHRSHYTIDPGVYANLAEMGHPDHPGDGLDREMASVYLHYADSGDARARAFVEAGVEAVSPEGHLSLNHSASATHRRDDWLAFVRGHKHDLMGMESYGDARSRPHRYMTYGSMQIIAGGDPPNPMESGWPNHLRDGWDPNFWPGTTSRLLPHKALDTEFVVYEQATEETFAVGTSLNDNGIYGLKITEAYPDTADPRRIGPPRYWLGEDEYRRRVDAAEYDTAFRARKSWFFFDDLIIAMGSGIESRDKHPVVTTLYQHVLDDADIEAGFLFDGQREDAFPFESDAEMDATRWLIDRNGTGYLLPAQENALRVRRVESAVETRDLAHSGPVERAWIDHGPSARGASYAYTVRPGTDAAAMADFAQAMADPQMAPFEILQHDALAHVVHHPGLSTTGYIVFDARHELPGEWLKAISRPAAVMLQAGEGGTLALSVADPEFGEHAEDPPRVWRRGPLWPTTLYLELQDLWETSHPDVIALPMPEGDRTLLRVICREGLPVRFELSARKNTTPD